MIDCEGGFDTSMYKYIAEELVKRHSKPHAKEKITPEYVKGKLFDKIHYKRILDNIDLSEILLKLPLVLTEKKKIKMVIIDSFPTHYKSIPDQKNTNKIVNEALSSLVEQAAKFNVCVRNSILG